MSQRQPMKNYRKQFLMMYSNYLSVNCRSRYFLKMYYLMYLSLKSSSPLSDLHRYCRTGKNPVTRWARSGRIRCHWSHFRPLLIRNRRSRRLIRRRFTA